MTRHEFEHQYVVLSDLGSVFLLHELGMRAYPCDCGEAVCKGWQMLTKTMWEMKAVWEREALDALWDGEELK